MNKALALPESELINLQIKPSAHSEIDALKLEEWRLANVSVNFMRTIAIILTLIVNWNFLIAQSTSIDSLRTDKKLISLLKKQFTLTEYDNADIVMSFNKDTILIAGYLSDFSV